MDVNALVAQLRIDEGVKYSVYQDSLGYWTIGVGHLVDARKGGKISDHIVNEILQEDVETVTDQLTANLPWWTQQPEPVQQVLANMCFNLGIAGLMTFTTFLGLVQAGNYSAAADDMLTTKWAGQVGPRAQRLATVMRGAVSQSQGTLQTTKTTPTSQTVQNILDPSNAPPPLDVNSTALTDSLFNSLEKTLTQNNT